MCGLPLRLRCSVSELCASARRRKSTVDGNRNLVTHSAGSAARCVEYASLS